RWRKYRPKDGDINREAKILTGDRKYQLERGNIDRNETDIDQSAGASTGESKHQPKRRNNLFGVHINQGPEGSTGAMEVGSFLSYLKVLVFYLLSIGYSF